MARVTASFFLAMRAFPTLGRAFTQDEQESRGARVVVISHAFWKSALAGDPGVLGRAMRLDGAPYTVIGVMPDGFALPNPTSIWIPLDVPPGDRLAITGARHYQMYGRLANGRTIRDAQADAIAFTKRTVAANADNREFRYEVQPMREELLAGAGSTVLLVQEGAVVLLLLAVLNLASLLIAWGFERQQELAVRQALGAAGVRVFRFSCCRASSGRHGRRDRSRRHRPNDPGSKHESPVAHVFHLTHRARWRCARGLRDGGGDRGTRRRRAPAWFSRRIDLAQSLRSGGRSTTHAAAGLRWQQGWSSCRPRCLVILPRRRSSGELPPAARARRVLRPRRNRRTSLPRSSAVPRRFVAQPWAERSSTTSRASRRSPLPASAPRYR
jgi:hypothetical protein